MRTTKAIIFAAFGTLIRYTARQAPYESLVDADGRPMDRLACLTRNVPLATLAIEIGVGNNLDLMLPDLAEELAGLRLAVCSNLAAEYGPAVRGLVPELGCAPAEAIFVGDSKRCDF